MHWVYGLNAFLHHVIAVLILDTFQHVAVQLLRYLHLSTPSITAVTHLYNIPTKRSPPWYPLHASHDYLNVKKNLPIPSEIFFKLQDI